MAPPSPITASPWEQMPTTSVRRLISPFTRSVGLVERNFGRCAEGKLMQPSTSLSASSIKKGAELFGTWRPSAASC
jgi:hypothetical protein